MRNYEKLLLGRIDAVYSPLPIALADIIDEMEVSDQVKLVPIEFLEPVRIYTVFSRKTVSKDVVENYNNALETISRDLKYIDYVKTYQSNSNMN